MVSETIPIRNRPRNVCARELHEKNLALAGTELQSTADPVLEALMNTTLERRSVRKIRSSNDEQRVLPYVRA